MCYCPARLSAQFSTQHRALDGASIIRDDRCSHVLFVSERHHGIDAQGAPGGQVRGQQGDGQEQRGDTG